jgi:pimeloyl-ACP methyl ester carboxylesterase
MIRESTLVLPHGITLACRAPAAPAASHAPPRVVFVHGFPEAAFIWDEVMLLLATQAACLAPQLRGFAGSSMPPDVADYRAKHLVADLAGVIDQAGAPIDLLVAHDWGGAVAWSLAAQRPQLVRRLLIINSPHPATFLRELRSSAAQQQASAYMSFLCRPDAERLLAEDDFKRLWRFFGEAPWLTDATRERYRATWRAGLSGALNYYRASPLRPVRDSDDALLRVRLDDDAVTVRVPTHVLWGDQDSALLPGLLEGLQRWVPELTIERLPEASHWLVHEQPARVAATVARLLAPPR